MMATRLIRAISMSEQGSITRMTSICLKHFFPLLVSKGIYHYHWKYVYFSSGLKQMEDDKPSKMYGLRRGEVPGAARHVHGPDLG